VVEHKGTLCDKDAMGEWEHMEALGLEPMERARLPGLLVVLLWMSTWDRVVGTPLHGGRPDYNSMKSTGKRVRVRREYKAKKKRMLIQISRELLKST